MSHSRNYFGWLAGFLALVLTACVASGPEESLNAEQAIEKGVAATLTKEAFEDNLAAARQTATAQVSPTPTLPPPPTVTASATALPSPTVIPSQTPTVTPAHLITPQAPTSRNTFVTDLITVDLAKDKTAVGDTYAWSRLERPYTAETMEYLDYLDIMRVDFQVRDPWVYTTFILIGDLPEEGEPRYAIELDLDHEGRGETIVIGSLPPDEGWTTDGVWVMEDADGDLGGLFPLYEDAPDPDQNGYETEVFAEGLGEDPDLAWVRRDPEHTNRIQLAFKKELLGQLGVLWSAWTDGAMKDPGLYDFNDHFTFEEAGSPNKDNYRYPVKAVSQVDSTCRSWYGFFPSGDEPGLCTVGESTKQDEPGMGFCETTYTVAGAGCIGPCLLECPPNTPCLPCQLP